MVKSSPWVKVLPTLGIVLALLLSAAAFVLWQDDGGSVSADADLGRLISTTQAARNTARIALSGQRESLDALLQHSTDIELQRRAIVTADNQSSSVRRLVADSAEWQLVLSALNGIVEAGAVLIDYHAARDQVMSLAPDLLASTGNLASSLSPTDLQANQIYLERFELTVQDVQQSARALAVPESGTAGVQRLSDAEQYLDQIIRGLRGEDSALGVTSVGGQAATDTLDAATTLFEETRAAIGIIVAAGEQVNRAQAAFGELDMATTALLDRYLSLNLSGLTGPELLDGRMPLAIVGAALFVALLMMLAYYRARDFRRAAEIQAEQNERNQQAILRLLDELSSLADGDLTVQATVTEDITGAIADSINYAIEALRELVVTVNDSSILVDAAAKQSESTTGQLVRSSETQSNQASAASDSISKMAASVEEVSGNAERCSDVARHAVDIAHKGGEAVRRTIDGMNTIRETIQDTSKRIKRLGESSQEIGNIVELIEEIAEQTNILALNASIEASRAGEASRGFAVVADEVQKLAERSSNATRKIEVLVGTIQSDTNEAVVSMERSTTDVVGGALLAENAGAALDEIEQVSHQIAALVQNISSSAHDQTGVSAAIDKNMQVLRQISANTKESTTATSSAIGKLSELASQLRRTVSGFTLPDHNTATGVMRQQQVAESLNRAELDPPAADDLVIASAEPRRQSG